MTDLCAPLRKALLNRRLPVGPVVVRAGELTIVFGRGVSRIEARLTGDGKAPAFRSWERFTLNYSGARELEPEQAVWMEALVEVLGRLEPRFDDLLARPGAAGLTEVPWTEALRMRFPFCSVDEAFEGDGLRTEVLVRLTPRCQQHCPFCSAPPPLPEPALRDLTDLLEALFASDRRGLVSLTGGEPTLRPDLADLVARALGRPDQWRVRIQTNAVSFADGTLVRRFPPAPHLSFFVSLHAVDPGLYDACTGTKHLLPAALAGLSSLLGAGHAVIVNCVANRLNADHLVTWVERLAALPEPRPTLHFSITMCPEHRPGAADVLARYGDLAPRLEAAVAKAAELGMAVDPLESSTHASIPVCMLRQGAHRERPHHPRFGEHEAGYEDMTKAWVKASSCRGCSEDPWCLGLPRPYVERFGLGELRPV